MNTKCHQITGSEATKGVDFWKSSRKILAVHTDMFGKFFGKQKAYSAAIDLTQGSSTDSDGNLSDPPAKRKRLTTEQKLTKKIDDMHETLQEIRSAKTIPEMAMECIVC